MPRMKSNKNQKKDVGSSSHETSQEKETFRRLCLPSEEGHTIEPHFFKIIISPSLQLKQLRLPLAFTKESESSLSNYAYLRAPGGNEQRVHLTKQDANIWFTHGWKDFAELYSIAHGHFLVFRYQGNSRFNVFIFDTSCCEIKYPSFDSNTSDDDEDENEEYDDDHDEYESASMPNDALKRAKEMECDNPHFIVSMNPSYLTSRMWIPLDHSEKYLSVDKNNVAKLEREGGQGTWIVSIKIVRNRLRFSGGWKRFTNDNHLKVDDRTHQPKSSRLQGPCLPGFLDVDIMHSMFTITSV